MDSSLSQRTPADRRNLISSIFIGLLLALAYQEMIVPARNDFRTNGFSLGLLVLLLIFFLTTIRFFIGAQLHLTNESNISAKGGPWFYDFAIITLEMTIMTFMGGVTSVGESRSASIGFFGMLSILLIADILWIVSIWIIGKVFPKSKRLFVPWGWAILNTALLIAMLVSLLIFGDPYGTAGLIAQGVLHCIAFVCDVMLIDHYDLMKE